MNSGPYHRAVDRGELLGATHGRVAFALDNRASLWYSPEPLQRIPTPELGGQTPSSSASVERVDPATVKHEKVEEEPWTSPATNVERTFNHVPENHRTESDIHSYLPVSSSVSLSAHIYYHTIDLKSITKQ